MTARQDEITSTRPIDVKLLGDEYEKGLVSIIMPAYNRAHLVEKTLRSVMVQEYPDIEVVVVDDGSTDGTADVVARLSDEFGGDRIRLVKQENAGAPAARNRGMTEARGEYIQFLDSDDLLHPDNAGMQVAMLEKRGDLDFTVTTSADFEDENDLPETLPVEAGEPINIESSLSGRYHFHTHGPFYRRSSLTRVGAWDCEIPYAEETEFIYRAMAIGLRGEFAPRAFGYRRIHAAFFLTVSRETKWKAVTDLLEKTLDTLKASGRKPPDELIKQLFNVRSRLRASEGDKAGALTDLQAAIEHGKKQNGREGPELRIRRWILKLAGARGYTGIFNVLRLFSRRTPRFWRFLILKDALTDCLKRRKYVSSILRFLILLVAHPVRTLRWVVGREACTDGGEKTEARAA